MPNLAIHMGFINTPYSTQAKAAPVKFAGLEERRVRARSFPKTMTAQKVANILEAKYGIVETFNEVYNDEITSLVHENFKQVAEKILARKGETTQLMHSLMKPSSKKIERMFKQFLDGEEMNGMIPGVPTKASGGKIRKRGRTIRPYPSFERTGIYKASFRCWIDTK